MYHVCVYRKWPIPTDGEPVEDNDLLFRDGMGSDDLFSKGWDRPARDLELPLLSLAYDDGLEVCGDALDALADEVDAIEKYWIADFIEEVFDDKQLRARLIETIAALRKAVDVARSQNGHLVLS